jgi:hypothetical protein
MLGLGDAGMLGIGGCVVFMISHLTECISLWLIVFQKYENEHT